MDRKPILLLFKNLVAPIQVTKESLFDMRKKLTNDSEKILIEALVVFSISRFESMFSDIIVYFLKKFPHKIDAKEIKLLKDEVISNEALELFIERYVNSIMYGRLDDILSYFESILSIKISKDQSQLEKLIEFKESRNLLLHNDSRVNRKYLEKCHGFKRYETIGSEITFDLDYVLQSISTILEIIENIESELEIQYSHFTNAKAFKELWEHIFTSPILKFNDYWEVNELEDTLIMKECRYERSISSSEKMFLGIWRVHYNGNAEHLKGFNMHTISDKNKMYLLLDALGELYLGG